MKKNWKRIISLICTLTLCAGAMHITVSAKDSYSGKLTVTGAQIPTENMGYIYLKGTDSYLSSNGEDWDSSAVKLNASADDEASGIFVNGVKQSGGLLKRYNGINNYYFAEGFTATTTGDVVTIKGTFNSQDGVAAVTYEESNFLWNGTQWVDCYKGKLTIEGAIVTSNTNSTNFYIQGTDGYKTGSDSWAETTMMPTADDTASGVFVDDVRVDNYFSAHEENINYLRLRKISDSGNDYYIEKIPNVLTGTIITIKGTFYVYGNWMETTLYDSTPVVFEESKFQWNGAQWVDYEAGSEEVVGYTGSLKVDSTTNTGNNFDATKFYMTGTDSFPLEQEECWESTMIPTNDASGIYVDGNRIENYFSAHEDSTNNVRLRKYSNAGGYYIEKIPGVKLGSIVTIKGSFRVYGNWLEEDQFDVTPIVFEESSFRYFGNCWMDCSAVKAYQDGTLTLDTNQTSSAIGLFLLGTVDVHVNCSPEEYPAFGWETSVGTMGIYKNGVACNAIMKNIASGAYYVDLGSAAIEDGNILTINGIFGYDGRYVNMAECSLMYVKERWVEGLKDTGVTCDMNADGVLNLKDFMRLKKHLSNKTTPISLTQMYTSEGTFNDGKDCVELFELLIKE